eukprot:Nk52_evm12s153 gene=Nk52_evmTU12s153
MHVVRRLIGTGIEHGTPLILSLCRANTKGNQYGRTRQVQHTAGYRSKNVKKKGRLTKRQASSISSDSPSSTNWLRRKLQDQYCFDAIERSYRSRSAFKLLHINQQFKILRKGHVVVDLGSSPGGWAQVAADKVQSNYYTGYIKPEEELSEAEITGMSDEDFRELVRKNNAEFRKVIKKEMKQNREVENAVAAGGSIESGEQLGMKEEKKGGNKQGEGMRRELNVLEAVMGADVTGEEPAHSKVDEDDNGKMGDEELMKNHDRKKVGLSKKEGEAEEEEFSDEEFMKLVDQSNMGVSKNEHKDAQEELSDEEFMKLVNQSNMHLCEETNNLNLEEDSLTNPEGQGELEDDGMISFVDDSGKTVDINQISSRDLETFRNVNGELVDMSKMVDENGRLIDANKLEMQIAEEDDEEWKKLEFVDEQGRPIDVRDFIASAKDIRDLEFVDENGNQIQLPAKLIEEGLERRSKKMKGKKPVILDMQGRPVSTHQLVDEEGRKVNWSKFGQGEAAKAPTVVPNREVSMETEKVGNRKEMSLDEFLVSRGVAKLVDEMPKDATGRPIGPEKEMSEEEELILDNAVAEYNEYLKELYRGQEEEMGEEVKKDVAAAEIAQSTLANEKILGGESPRREQKKETVKDSWEMYDDIESEAKETIPIEKVDPEVVAETPVSTVPKGSAFHAPSVGKVVGVDINFIDPIPGVTLLEKTDILEPSTVDKILSALEGEKANVVLSDMASSSSGNRFADHTRVVNLCKAALDVGKHVLKEDGSFVCKMFDGEYDVEFLALLRKYFKSVRRSKPDSSHKDSREFYFVATGYTPSGDADVLMRAEKQRERNAKLKQARKEKREQREWEKNEKRRSKGAVIDDNEAHDQRSKINKKSKLSDKRKPIQTFDMKEYIDGKK